MTKRIIPIEQRLYHAVAGAVVAKLRAGAKWTQADLAMHTKITQSTLSRIENGAPIDAYALRCLRDHLHEDLSDLVDQAVGRAEEAARALLGSEWPARLSGLGHGTLKALALLAAEGA